MLRVDLLCSGLCLAACGASDPTAPTTEHRCEDFIDDPTYVYAGGKTTIDVTGIDAVNILGLLLTIPPKGADETGNNPVMVEPGRWSVLAVNWNGQIGKAVQVRGDNCTAVWVERL